MRTGFLGKHYETGTIVNALAARGAVDPKTGGPYSEALVLGASGGIAFGYFVFEYKGHLPHVALLTRNTFSPFGRALDNLGIRRESRETTDGDRAERNLRLELDSGNAAIVWADSYTLPYSGLSPSDQMWAMRPLAVVGEDGNDFLIADGPKTAFPISAKDLNAARARVKKDRFRMMVLEPPDPALIPDGLARGIETCLALFLDKPPAGSPNNFGIASMRHWAKMLVDSKNPKSWAKTFEPGPRLAQALAGCFGQPGVWDWVETWGTSTGGDRETFAEFLTEASSWLGKPELLSLAGDFRQSASLWRGLADESLPDELPETRSLKELKRRHSAIWRERGLESLSERAEIRVQMTEPLRALADPAKLATISTKVQGRMAEIVTRIAEIEEAAMFTLREITRRS